MAEDKSETPQVKVRIAKNQEEIEAALHLRYRVFYEEYNAIPSNDVRQTQKDFDLYDNYAEHLIVIDENIADKNKRIVGTYRLMNKKAAEKAGQFYTSGEFDISNILEHYENPLELGRSCVLAEYRTRPVLQLLWQGILDYILDNDISMLFGCGSLEGTNIDAIADQLSYLYHFHLAAPEIRPHTLDEFYTNMNLMPKDDIHPKKVFASLPPLFKGYLRAGSEIGDGAFIDRQFNTTDVCIVIDTAKITDRYRKFYERRLNADQAKQAEALV